MLHLLHLLLPALIPSWRFFKTVEPSPRVQWSLVKDGARDWQEYAARPASVSAIQMLCRLFWNPRWNDALYMVSLAERETIAACPHSKAEISQRIRRKLLTSRPAQDGVFQFRILYVFRDEDGLHQSVTYEGPLTPIRQ